MRRILLTDDDPDTLLILEKLFASTFPDIQIFKASNGAIALRLCCEHSFDLICTDFDMPVLNGLDFIRILRQGHNRNHKTGVIILSGNVAKFKESAADIPAVHILEKPIRFDRMLPLLPTLRC